MHHAARTSNHLRWLLRIGAAVGSVVVAMTTAFAQGYLARPIQLVVPFAPGGGADKTRARGLALQTWWAGTCT